MKITQIEANVDLGDNTPNNEVLRAAGVRRIHNGWYTVLYHGPVLDQGTVCGARRNPRGEILMQEDEKKILKREIRKAARREWRRLA